MPAVESGISYTGVFFPAVSSRDTVNVLKEISYRCSGDQLLSASIQSHHIDEETFPRHETFQMCLALSCFIFSFPPPPTPPPPRNLWFFDGMVRLFLACPS
jgi:hypothetical protein